MYTVWYNGSMSDVRECLLKNAMELFSARGYDAVGIQEIIDTVGVGKPTLYHYFGSKRGLLDAAFKEYFEPFFATFNSAAAYRKDVAGCLNGVAAAFFVFALENQAFYRLFRSAHYAPPESELRSAALEYKLRLLSSLEEFFLQASNDHGNMKGRHKVYALTFLGLVFACVDLQLETGAKLDDAFRYKTVHQFMHGIFS